LLLAVIPGALLLIRRSRVSFVRLLLREREKRERRLAAGAAG
jgi:hypothetical protein